MNIRVAIFLWLLNYVSAQDANCDFYQVVQSGNVYYVYSTGWPNNYTGGIQCRWIADCPSGYNCRLDCPEIYLPYTQSCYLDRLLISRSGDPQLTAAETYCGRGSVSVMSTGQRITIGLITNRSSPGGRFRCQLTAQPAIPTTQCQCGERKQNRIVGGEETGVNEFKMMAGLVDTRISQIDCGAVIISDKHVLTAAHCVLNKPTTELAVVVGEHDVNTADSLQKGESLYKVARITMHPLYNQSNYDYDIAIVTVEGTIQFNNAVGPACMPFKFRSNDFAGNKVTALGWGTLFPGGPTSNTLQKVVLDVISQNSCRSQVSALTDRQMCTFTAGKDACQYDSGGPVLYTDPNTGLLFNVGIISYGRFCASSEPGINTRVTTLLDWIEANAQYNYCIK